MTPRQPPPPGAPAALRTTPPLLPVIASFALIVLLVLPVGVLLIRALAPGTLATLLQPAAAEALRLSLLTTGASMALTVLLGTPVAYLLARYTFRGRRFLDVLVDLPVMLPPVVAGVGLLLVFGRRGILGEPLSSLGVNLAFTTTAVVLAQLFVASPFYIRALKVGFAGVPRELEAAALIDGADRAGGVLARHLAAGTPGLWRRIGARVGAGFGRVRRDGRFCRKLTGPHADAAAGDLRSARA